MRVFYGVDVGTSFLKAAVLDADSLELRHIVRAPFPSFAENRPPGHIEADPLKVCESVQDLLSLLQRETTAPAAIVWCGQMHGIVLIDGKGNPVSPFFPWLDQRVPLPHFESLHQLVTNAEQIDLGNEFRPNTAVPLLHWLKQGGELPSGEITPVSIADFIAARLCGTKPLLEPTQAAALGAFNVRTMEWHREVIGKLGLEAIRWPEVRPAGSVVGFWQGTSCYSSIGDQQCGLAGAMLSRNELAVNIGTGSQVAALSTEFPTTADYQVRPYFDGQFLTTITHIPGGRALSALIGLLGELGEVREETAWPKIEAAVRATPVTDLLASLAFFQGACGNRGSLDNLHEFNLTVGHVFRAAFESMARNYATCGRRLDPEKKRKGVVFAGGVARRLEVLRELTVSAMDLPSRLSPHPEDTLFGLLLLGLAFHDKIDVGAATKILREGLPA